MVQRHLAERGIKNPRVLEAFRTVPRHRFLPPETRRQAYDDESIPIGEGQTITPPYDVAFMTEVLDPQPTDKVYEVGTGSGYQAAILSRLVKEVYSVEIHAPLSERATAVHKELGYTNIHTRVGDGYEGWPEAAPFDAIIVTCAPQRIPSRCSTSSRRGAGWSFPLGDRFTQSVHLVIKKDGKLIDQELKPTLFVPMTGKALKRRPNRPAQAPDQNRPRAGAAVTPPSRRSSWRMKNAVVLSAGPGRWRPGPRPGPGARDRAARAAGGRRSGDKTANKDGVPDGWYNAPRRDLGSQGGRRRAPLRPVRVHPAGPAGAAEPGVRRRWPQDRGHRAGALGQARATSSTASAPAKSRAC